METEESSRSTRREVDPEVLQKSVDNEGHQIALANFGPIDIILEVFRLLYTHPKFFFQIQFALVLPIMIFNVGLLTILTSYVPKALPPSPGGSVSVFLSRELGQPLQLPIMEFPRERDPSLLPTLILLCPKLISELLVRPCGYLWVGAVYYSVGLIYTGKNVSFFDVVHRIPILWKRLMTTWLWLVRFVVAVILLFIGIIKLMAYLLGASEIASSWMWITLMAYLVGESEIPPSWMWLTLAEIIFTLTYLTIIYEVAEGVCVLEEGCGLAALGKSKQLLRRGRMWVAVRVLAIVYFLAYLLSVLVSQTENMGPISPKSIEGIWKKLVLLLGIVINTVWKSLVNQLIVSISLNSGEGHWEKLVLLLWILIDIVWKSLVSQLIVLCRAVMYASFKANRSESIANSSFFKEMTKDGYHRLGVPEGSVESDSKTGFPELRTDGSEEIDLKGDQLISFLAKQQNPDNLV